MISNDVGIEVIEKGILEVANVTHSGSDSYDIIVATA